MSPMGSPTAPRPRRPERLPTHISGLDRVLRGGIPRGSVVLIAGAPGTGKTTLGTQLAFHHAERGATAVVATLMAESHDRMLAHLSGFDFFDPALVGERVRYLSLMAALDEGIDAVPEALRRIVREHGTTLLVVDGTTVIDELADSRLDFRHLTNRLQVQSALLGCTTILLINRDPDDLGHIATHADGLVDLRQELVGSRRVRTLEVVKLRGADHLGGRHEFAIGSGGIAVYPRLEATLAGEALVPEPSGKRLGFGVPTLDAMVGGGLLPGSATVLMGTPGAGKTLTGLHLIAEGVRLGERGLIAGFHESPERLVRTAAGIGLDLATPIERGLVRILWRPPLELSPDAWAWELLATVDEFRPSRLMVDALSVLEPRLPGADRSADFVGALAGALRASGVTALFTVELGNLIGPELRVPLPVVAATLDNLILLRYFELGACLRRMVSVLKVRETAFDPALRGFTISDQGLEIGDPFAGAAGFLTGAPVSGTGGVP